MTPPNEMTPETLAELGMEEAMTPEKLRVQFAALLIGLNIRTGKDAEVIHRVYEFVDAAADAWTADLMDKALAITALAICREQRNEEQDRAIAAEARIEALEKALRQCEPAPRMPWLNTVEESQKALDLIDAALPKDSGTDMRSEEEKP